MNAHTHPTHSASYEKNTTIISRAAFLQRHGIIYFLIFFSTSSVSNCPTVQSRSLQNLQASRVLHVIDSAFSAEDEAQPLHRHFPGDRGLEDITALMGKLGVKQERSSLESVSLNSSQEDGISHFHVDPITGHIATVTLNPHRPAGLQPHADDM